MSDTGEGGKDNRVPLVRYRMEQAREALEAGRLLFAEGHYRGAINRAYYAIFYSVLALLVTRELGTSSHSGALTLFNREFIKTGQLPRALSTLARHAEVFLQHVTDLLPTLIDGIH